MRGKLLLLIPLALALVLGATGWWLMSLAPEAMERAIPEEFRNPPSPLALAPPGARLNAWFMNTVFEARRDGTLLVLASILLMASLLKLVSPSEQRRMRTSVFFFFLYVVTVPLSAIVLAGGNLEAYGWLRGLALLFEAITVTHLAALFLFDVFLALVRIPVPPIIRELLTGVAYLVVALSVLSRGGVHLSGILTTSAILTAVVGLSIQSTLGDVVSGVVLEWEDTIEVGDWVKINDVTGKVREIRWRHMTIETRNWETVVIPNSNIMKTQVSILGRRSGSPLQLRRWIYFQVGYEHAPDKVIDAVTEALTAAPIERVAASPPPNAILFDFKESAALYAVRYWLTDLPVDDPTDSLVRTRVYHALKRAGIDFSLPAREVTMTANDDATRARETAQQMEERLAALRRMGLFSMLKQDECYALVPHLRYAPFARGEVMTRQGAVAHWLYLLVKGQATVQINLPDGRRKTIATLKEGDYFGEMGLLTGERRSADVFAETDCVCWRLDRDGFRNTVQKRPEIAEELAQILAARRVALQDAQVGASRQSLQAAQRDLVKEISAFFGLS